MNERGRGVKVEERKMREKKRTMEEGRKERKKERTMKGVQSGGERKNKNGNATAAIRGWYGPSQISRSASESIAAMAAKQGGNGRTSRCDTANAEDKRRISSS